MQVYAYVFEIMQVKICYLIFLLLCILRGKSSKKIPVGKAILKYKIKINQLPSNMGIGVTCGGLDTHRGLLLPFVYLY
jgi:hypothetical protein